MHTRMVLIRLLKIKPIVFLLSIFVSLSLYYSLATPLFEGPDENLHYEYIAYLIRGQGLPIQSTDPKQATIHQGIHPPLYYVLVALVTSGIDLNNEASILRFNPQFVWAGLGDEPNLVLHTAAEQFPYTGLALLTHLARMISILFGAVTVWGTFQLGKIITDNQSIAVGSAALVALNPQFIFISSVINNDNAVIAFSTLATVTAASILMTGRSRRRMVWLGVWMGLALLSKLSALTLVPLVAFVVAVCLIRERSWRVVSQSVLWIGLPIILISGWWFIRNQVLYGDPIGYQVFEATHGNDSSPKDFTQWATWVKFSGSIHQSFWGKFGWVSIPLKSGLYDLLAALYLFAALGAAIGSVWRREISSVRRVRLKLGVPFLMIAAGLWMIWVLWFGRGQGRLLFPAISVIAILIVIGVSSIVPDRLRWFPIGLISGGLATLAIAVPSQYILPAYRYFTLPESALQSLPHRLEQMTFSPEITLAGYDVQRDDGGLTVKFYWAAQGTPAQDYKVFIHAFNISGQLCGQEDSLPLSGSFPMTVWRSGDVIEDTHSVPVDAACWGGAGRRLDIGLYREDTTERLLYSLNGQPISDHLEIALENE